MNERTRIRLSASGASDNPGGGTAGAPANAPGRSNRKRKGLRRFLVGLLGLIVGLAVIVGLAGPRIASWFVPGIMQTSLNGHPGRIVIKDLGLSWAGPQRIGQLRVEEADGRNVADLRIEAASSLLDLALGGGDLGTITLSGSIDVREGLLTPAAGIGPGAGPSQPAPPTAPKGGARPGAGLELPTGIKLHVEAQNLSLTYAGARPGSSPVKFDAIDAFLDYDRAQTLALKAVCASPALTLNVMGVKLVDGAGRLALDRAEIGATANATLPGDVLEALTRAALAASGVTAAGEGGDDLAARAGEPATLALSVRARDGRLRLADPAMPVTLRAPVPRALIAAAAGAGAGVELRAQPVLSLSIASLDIPLAGAAGAPIDWRGASLRATLGTTELRGTALIPGADDQRPHEFVVEPTTLSVDVPDLAKALVIKARTRCMLDSSEAGVVDLDVRAEGLLDASGALRAAAPAPMSAMLKARGVPTRMLEPLARRYNIDLQESVGPTLDIELSALTRAAADGADPKPPAAAPGSPPGSASALPATEVIAKVNGRSLDAWVVAVIDDKGLHTEGKGARLQADRLGSVLRPFLKDSGLALEGDGMVIAEAKDLSVPLVTGMPDLSRLAGVVRLAVGNLTLTHGLGADPIEIKSLDSQITLAPERPIGVAVDYRLASGGHPFRATGQGEITGLLTRKDGAAPWVELTPGNARATGVIDVADLPTDLAGLVPQRLRNAVAQSIGPTAVLHIDAKPGASGAGATDLALRLTSPGAEVSGALTVDSTSINALGDGLSLTLKSPGALASALLPASGDGGPTIGFSSPLRITLTNFSAPLPTAGAPFALDQVEADARVQTAEIAVDLPPSSSSAKAERLTAQNFDLTGALSKKEGASVAVASKGAYQGKGFSVEGRLALGRLVTTKEGGLDLAALKPVGKFNLTDVPTALADLFAPRQRDVIRELAGEQLSLEIIAPAPAPTRAGAAASAGQSVALNLHAAGIQAQGSAYLNQRVLTLGTTNIKARVTPRLVELVSAQAAPTLAPRPSLSAPADFQITVQPVIVSFAPDNSPDLKTLRPVSAMLLGKGDAVFTNLPGLDDNQRLGLGVRDLTIGITYDRGNMLASEGSVKATLFDPAEPGAALAKVDVLSSLINPPPSYTAALRDVDGPRVDRWLASPGLLTDSLGEAAGLSVISAMASNGAPRSVQVNLESTRLRTAATMVQLPDRWALAGPVSALWEMKPEWANRYLTPPPEDGRPATLRFTDPTKVQLSIEKLSVGLAPRPLDPAIFAFQARAALPSVRLTTAKGEAVHFQDLAAAVKSESAPGSISFTLSAREERAGERDRVEVIGGITDLSDAAGSLTRDKARLTARASGSMPTAVLDALGQYDGLLVDLLGDTTRVDIDAKALSRQSGSLRATMVTDNADARVAGSIQGGGVFTTDAPATAKLTRISRGLSDRVLESVLPIVSRVEKTARDDPATVTATGLTLPIDGDTRKLNGLVNVDLGTVQFETSSFFGELLKITKQKSAGRLGDRIQPFEFRIDQGVVSYERIELPIGEFKVVTRGKVDLNTRKMDVVTFVPVYAIADELSGVLAKTPGLDKLAMVPIRTKGPLEKPKSEIDLSLILEEGLPGAATKGVGGVIEGVGGILDGLNKKKQADEEKKKKKKPEKKP